MTMMSHAHAFALAASVSLLLGTLPTRAANEIQPGLWQDTEISEIDGKAQPPKVSTDCVKPEDAKDPVKLIQESMKEQGQTQQCSKLDIKANGNIVLFEMKCGDPKQGSVEMTMTYTVHSPQHTSSVGKSTMTMMGKTIVSNLNTDSKWLAAACKK